MTQLVANAATEVVELSGYDRLGLKGRGAARWLADRGVEMATQANRVVVQADGLVVARYAENEFAFADFSSTTAGTVETLRRALERERPPGCYSVPRVDSQAAFGLAGDAALHVLSALCPADLRPRAFGPGDVLQTLCAGVSAQLWQLPNEPVLQVIVLCDSSVAHHQRAALRGAIASTQGASR